MSRFVALVSCLVLAACGASEFAGTVDDALPRLTTTTTVVGSTGVPATVSTTVPPSTAASTTSTPVPASTVPVATTTTGVPIPLGAGGATTTTTPATTAPPSTSPPSMATSDSFDGTALGPHWRVRRPDAVDLAVADGVLRIDVADPAPWDGDRSGFLLHQPVDGDVALRAVVRVRRTADPSSPPDQNRHVGGVMLRDPAADDTGGVTASENHVTAVVGRSDDGLAVAWTSTDDGASTATSPTWPSSDAELRICRRGDRITMTARTIGAASWEAVHTVVRPDLPTRLQAGVIAHAAATPDLRVLVDSVVFGTPDELACP